MGSGLCIGPCPPAQRMAYSQSMASSQSSRPAEQNQQTVSRVADSNATSKPAAISVPARSNSVIDVQA